MGALLRLCGGHFGRAPVTAYGRAGVGPLRGSRIRAPFVAPLLTGLRPPLRAPHARAPRGWDVPLGGCRWDDSPANDSFDRETSCSGRGWAPERDDSPLHGTMSARNVPSRAWRWDDSPSNDSFDRETSRSGRGWAPARDGGEARRASAAAVRCEVARPEGFDRSCTESTKWTKYRDGDGARSAKSTCSNPRCRGQKRRGQPRHRRRVRWHARRDSNPRPSDSKSDALSS